VRVHFVDHERSKKNGEWVVNLPQTSENFLSMDEVF
jgi:hypothetical protein